MPVHLPAVVAGHFRVDRQESTRSTSESETSHGCTPERTTRMPPQTPNSSIHPVLNGSPPASGTDYYDDDNVPPNPPENHDFCNDTIPNRLEVRVTEDNTFPLASLIPLFPDIKRKATVELQEAEGVSGLLPIAVRAPEPVSMMAVFYNENGTILNRKYFVKKDLSGAGLPGGLQGGRPRTRPTRISRAGHESTSRPADSNVLVAVSFRGACNTRDPSTNPSGPPGGITIEASALCFEDGLGGAQTFSTVNELCNQGGSVQIANCYHASGAFPTETVQSGLHFIRSYNPASVGGNGPPELNSAYFTPSTCSGTGYGTGYFTTFPNVCTANLSGNIDVGTCYRLPQGSGWTGPRVPAGTPTATETRTSDNVEGEYTIVSGTGNNDDTCDFGPACDLADSGAAAGYGVNCTSRSRSSRSRSLRRRTPDPAQGHRRAFTAQLQQQRLQRWLRVVLPGERSRPHAADERRILRRPGAGRVPRQHDPRRRDQVASHEGGSQSVPHISRRPAQRICIR